ncbi:oligoribonuclease [uncultured Pseudoteredinibacter sp.]|uniref:oligoribonuclease n=1 Tax=uncultured Pseudoteredinibacter sp. TaxID=1641701 RepID=UPI00262EE44B|nr:oligoribonuclease [uncultured Pseudoteredinibacter sp.]
MPVSDTHLIWIDLEMTGLIPESDVIIEIATIVTDADLNILAEGPVQAIKQPKGRMEKMDAWNTKTHGASGLTERVLSSQVNLGQAEQETLGFLRQWLPPAVSPMCGNSICQDRRFMARYMPELEAFFHYRNLDVSTIKELAKRWRPSALEGFSKQGSHLALDDIRESIAELKHYRGQFIDPEFS